MWGTTLDSSAPPQITPTTRPISSSSEVAVEEPAREQVRGVAEHDAAGADRVPGIPATGRDQPRPDAADNDHDRGHEREPLGALERDDQPHEHERDRVRDQVLPARVDERRGEDAPDVADVARAGSRRSSRWFESSVLISSTEPHEHDDPGQHRDAFELRLTSTDPEARGRWLATVVLTPLRIAGALARPIEGLAKNRPPPRPPPAPPRRAAQRRRKHELLGRVGAAAARAEPVDGQRDIAARSGWRRWRRRAGTR